MYRYGVNRSTKIALPSQGPKSLVELLLWESRRADRQLFRELARLAADKSTPT